MSISLCVCVCVAEDVVMMLIIVSPFCHSPHVSNHLDEDYDVIRFYCSFSFFLPFLSFHSFFLSLSRFIIVIGSNNSVLNLIVVYDLDRQQAEQMPLIIVAIVVIIVVAIPLLVILVIITISTRSLVLVGIIFYYRLSNISWVIVVCCYWHFCLTIDPQQQQQQSQSQ